MYHPTTRVLAVLALLQRHQRMSGAELAERIEVDIRTLRRYIITLQDLGVPIEAERGRYGGYRLTEEYLTPLFFNNDEMMALAFGLLAAGKLGVAEIVPAVDSVRVKLAQSMPVEMQLHIEALSETILLDMEPQYVVSLSQAILAVSQGIKQRQTVKLRYKSREQIETEREFAPYGITFYQSLWYAVGYCYLRDELRSFRLDRVVAAEPGEQEFNQPDGFDALAYMVKTNATIPRKYDFEVLLLATEAEVAGEKVSYLGVLREVAEGFRLSGTVDDFSWLARELARLSCRFRVVAPVELQEAVRQLARELVVAAKE